jgi:hypothetical protein
MFTHGSKLQTWCMYGMIVQLLSLAAWCVGMRMMSRLCPADAHPEQLLLSLQV